MAVEGCVFYEDANRITVTNDSGTTAITAGDLCYFTTNNDEYGSTVATAKTNSAASNVMVKAAKWSTTSHLMPAGVAIQDIAADGAGSMYLEGLFLHRVSADTEAGECLIQETTTSGKVVAFVDLGTTVLVQGAGLADLKIGRALTGGSAENKIILWKLSL